MKKPPPLSYKMPFSIDDRVFLKSDPGRGAGIIRSKGPLQASIQYWGVFWGGNFGETTHPELDLEPADQNGTPLDNLMAGRFSGYSEFLRQICYQRLRRDAPLRNNIYAFNASRTELYPYQFKPLIKFLDSPIHRLLICDEVGLGKTIEAGLILTELRARQSVKRVLVVCPSNLTKKWRKELKLRFGEDFRIIKTPNFLEFLSEYSENDEAEKFNGIISLESIRSQRSLNELELVAPVFDLVIVDEAHHMRNFSRNQRRAGLLLSQTAGAMVLLTATPIHLGNENLFSLLNILDENDFPNVATAENRFQNNEPIVCAQACLGQIPPNIEEALNYLTRLRNSSWLRNNALYEDILRKLRNFRDTAPNNREVIDLLKDVSELNLLGHIFTRTRKREVHENFPQRHAHAIQLEFSEIEREFYDAVTNYVREETEARGYSPLIQQWVLNMPQRRMSSSIPAMVKHYKDSINFSENDFPEEMNDLDLDSNEPTINIQNVESAEDHLRDVISRWPGGELDSKYDQFVNMLYQLKEKGNPLKIVVFAFFKATLNYLYRRLENDGFCVCIIHGEIDPEERSDTIERFKMEDNREILLSSRVGSEGLDFQFCNTLFNYDLPWNPMEVEQRIGRLDRIGQKSPVINIYNFWTQDTIEERILRRLYERIDIFKYSIGALEDILGDVIRDLEREIFSQNLTEEEEEQKVQNALNVLENKRSQKETLESEAAKFIGTDNYFEEEVNAIKKCKRYITSKQMRRFVNDFLREYAPRTTLEYNEEKNLGTLKPDERLNELIREGDSSLREDQFYSIPRNGIKVTFDSDAAFNNPKIEFINVLHPIVRTIVNKYRTRLTEEARPHHVLLQSNSIDSGFYYFFVFRLTERSARTKNILESIFLDENLNEMGDIFKGEQVLGEMVEQGQDPVGPLEIPPETAMQSYDKAEQLLVQRIDQMKENAQESNDRFTQSRINSLEVFYDRILNRKNELLANANREGRNESYIRRLRTTIQNKENEKGSRVRELEGQREVNIAYEKVASGILEVTEF